MTEARRGGALLSDCTGRRTTAAESARAKGALEQVFNLALSQLEVEGDLPRLRDRSPEDLRRELDIHLSSEGSSFEAVVEKLRRILAETPSSASPRFLNQLFGGRDPIAVAAEMLVPLTNTSMYTYKVAGPQVLVEQEVLGRMAAKIGYREGEGLFTPGGSLANLTAMLMARNEAVADARDKGLRVEGLISYTSADGHYSIRKNAGILGMGRENVHEVRTDPHGRMDVAALRRMIRQDRADGKRPLLINATAGTTVLGAFDPIRALSEVARDEKLWLHIDGALGGSVLLSEKHRHILEGAELSHSFAWNAHKMMGVPLSCSALLLRRSDLLANHLGESAEYLFQGDEDALNPGRRSIQCGRRNDALKLWAAWQLHGDRGYAERIDRLFELAAYAARVIDADPDLELTMTPASVNVCFEVRGKSSVEICRRLETEGRLLIGHGLADGRTAIRLVCINPDLGERDIDARLREIKRTAADLP